jgi:hypothetical protein
MKTVVLMKRDLFGMTISQNSKTEYFSSTDLLKAGNKWRAVNDLPLFNEKAWFKNKGTIEYIEEIEKRHGKAKIPARGRGQHTWIHPLLFIDLALSISPKLKIEAYSWMFDHLIKFRNDSGDSYKDMCGSLFAHAKNKVNFYIYIRDTAIKIKSACHVSDWNEADEHQLKLRDKIHNDIALLADVLNNNDEAVRIAILKAIK